MFTDIFKKKTEEPVEAVKPVRNEMDEEKKDSLIYIANSIKTFQKELKYNILKVNVCARRLFSWVNYQSLSLLLPAEFNLSLWSPSPCFRLF